MRTLAKQGTVPPNQPIQMLSALLIVLSLTLRIFIGQGTFFMPWTHSDSSHELAYTWTSQQFLQGVDFSANSCPGILPGNLARRCRISSLCRKIQHSLYSKHARLHSFHRYHTAEPCTITNISASYLQGSHFDILWIYLSILSMRYLLLFFRRSLWRPIL
jgi:hypothetical protein